jgi:SAP domain/Protein of unknown function (DUF669)
MAKIKYDVRDVEPSRDFDKPIPVGVYKMIISSAVIKPAKSGDKMLEIELEVPKGEHKGRKVWEYIVLNESSEWKLRQLIDSLGEKLKGSLDTDKLIGKTLLAKIKHEPWERDNDDGETEIVVMSKVGSLLKPKSEDEEEEAEDEESEEEAEEPEADAEEAEEEAEPEEEADAEDEDSLTWDDLAGYDRGELKEFIKDNESAVKVLKKDSDDDIRKKIAEEWEVEIPSDEEEESEEAEEEETADEDEAEDYSEWAMPDLKKELKARDLKVSGTKKALVKRLEKDDSKAKGGSKKKKDEPF